MNASPIPLFPLSTVLFPDGYLPLQIFEVRYLDMVKRAIAAGTGFGIVTLTDGAEVRTPDATEAVAPIGTLVQIRAHAAPMPGLMQIQCIGTSRFRIDSSERLKHGLWMGQVTLLSPDQSVAIPDELEDTADALWVANRWAELLPFPAEQKLRLLELDNPLVRLELIQDLLHAHGVL
jgi:Lon protease-like protein